MVSLHSNLLTMSTALIPDNVLEAPESAWQELIIAYTRTHIIGPDGGEPITPGHRLLVTPKIHAGHRASTCSMYDTKSGATYSRQLSRDQIGASLATSA